MWPYHYTQQFKHRKYIFRCFHKISPTDFAQISSLFIMIMNHVNIFNRKLNGRKNKSFTSECIGEKSFLSLLFTRLRPLSFYLFIKIICILDLLSELFQKKTKYEKTCKMKPWNVFLSNTRFFIILTVGNWRKFRY